LKRRGEGAGRELNGRKKRGVTIPPLIKTNEKGEGELRRVHVRLRL